MTPRRHPVDLEKSNRALGFPTLITGLCQFYGVPIAPNKVIQPPITRAFIEKYHTSRKAQGEAPQQLGDTQPQAADAPPSPLESTSVHLRRLERYI